MDILLLILGCNAAFLAWHPNYEDGLSGRLALGAIVLGVVVILIGLWSDILNYYFPPELVVIVGGCTAFFLRHTYRWLRWKRTGKGGWRNKFSRQEVA